ncbi:MAG: tRNA epoxyqueuosine(34) reductase QueG [Pseudomonadota bacterium]
MADLKADLVAEASSLGFAAARVTRPEAIPEAAEGLAAFLGANRHGEMSWMAERTHWRGNPKALWPEARSIVMVADLYTPAEDPLATLTDGDVGTISVYARNRDYHDIAKKRLKALARWVVAHTGGEVKVFVDTAPVMEKPLAAAAGLGWQGKHTNLLSRDLGNWFFLGALFTTAEMIPDAPVRDSCGSCRACLDVCPTDAFPAPYQLDARRCISYLTIEHKGPVDPGLRVQMGNRIYGCDDCLAVCPWNKFAAEASEARYAAKEELVAPPLAELATLDDATFRERFRGSPIKRIGVNRFLRNVLYAIGNSGRPSMAPWALRHTGSDDAVVRDAAQWALARLSGRV